MDELQKIKCKSCEADLDINQAVDGVLECPYCHSIWTIPKKETNPAALSFLRQGEHDLDTCKFDDAYTAYAKAAELDKEEPEAYFGMALAEFRIQYLKDQVNNRLQPICHEVTSKKFTESMNFLRASRYATNSQRQEYEKRAEEIDYILGEFYKLEQSGADFDCFLCVKVTDDETKTKTEDSKDADYIYELLSSKGYKPFYSERVLRNVTGADYEARILYALVKSECMLVVCRNEAYLQTRWVKNEYTRFLKLVNDEEKESDSITIVFNGAPVERLPGRAGKLQGIDFSRRDADGKIVDFVETHTPEARARREAAARARVEEEERRQKRQQEWEEEQKRLAEQRAEEERKRYEALREEVRASAASGGSGGVNINALLTRAAQELEDRRFGDAQQFYNEVRNNAPHNPFGWWGLFLCDNKATNSEEVAKRIANGEKIELTNNRNYAHAMQYRNEDFDRSISEFQSYLKKYTAEAMIRAQKLHAASDTRAAAKQYQNVLNAEAENPQAYWGLFLCDNKATSANEIARRIANGEKIDVASNPNYANAVKYRNPEIDRQIADFQNSLKKYAADTMATAQSLYMNGRALDAAKQYENVLNVEPQNSAAHWELFRIEAGLPYECKVDDNLGDAVFICATKSPHLKNALKYASPDFKKQISDVLRQMKRVSDARAKRITDDIAAQQTKMKEAEVSYKDGEKKRLANLQSAQATLKAAQTDLKNHPEGIKKDLFVWNGVGFGFTALGLAVAWFLTLFVLHLIGSVWEELPTFFTWDIPFGYAIDSDCVILEGPFYFVVYTLAFIVQGALYGGVSCVGLFLVFNLFRSIFVAIHNAKADARTNAHKNAQFQLSKCARDVNKIVAQIKQDETLYGRQKARDDESIKQATVRVDNLKNFGSWVLQNE